MAVKAENARERRARGRSLDVAARRGYVHAHFHGGKVQASMDDSFAAITNALEAELARERAVEQEDEAREIVRDGDATRSFVDELRRVPPGEVVTLVASDGVPLRGRLVRVGSDWLRIGEVADDFGAGRARLLRVHDVRLDAVVRLSRDARQ